MQKTKGGLVAAEAQRDRKTFPPVAASHTLGFISTPFRKRKGNLTKVGPNPQGEKVHMAPTTE